MTTAALTLVLVWICAVDPVRMVQCLAWVRVWAVSALGTETWKTSDAMPVSAPVMAAPTPLRCCLGLSDFGSSQLRPHLSYSSYYPRVELCHEASRSGVGAQFRLGPTPAIGRNQPAFHAVSICILCPVLGGRDLHATHELASHSLPVSSTRLYPVKGTHLPSV